VDHRHRAGRHRSGAVVKITSCVPRLCASRTLGMRNVFRFLLFLTLSATAGRKPGGTSRRAHLFIAAAFLLLAACAAPPPPGPVPKFAEQPYALFNRADAVAIALREWRLFGSKVDDGPPQERNSNPPAADKPERQPGLWQRVGEYWWIGLAGAAPEGAWTGKHDANGEVFAAADDGRYAWSAAFMSYVMRVAGAGARFPYAANHATYVNAAAAGASPILKAEPPERYPPRAGDLICLGRFKARALRFADLPTDYFWPGHCAMVAAAAPGSLATIAGNVGDAVTMIHVPTTETGTIAGDDGTPLDKRYPWFVVVRVIYDAEAEPEGSD